MAKKSKVKKTLSLKLPDGSVIQNIRQTEISSTISDYLSNLDKQGYPALLTKIEDKNYLQFITQCINELGTK